MPTTTNYGWTTPADTDLVKDGAAAIRTLGSSIDTTLKTQIDAQIPDTIFDAKGDLISATAADTPARLASSGVNGDVLTVDTSTSTGLKWAAPAAGGLTSIATGTLSGSAVAITSIPGTYKNLQLVIRNFYRSADGLMQVRFNNDSNNRYWFTGSTSSAGNAFSSSESRLTEDQDSGVGNGLVIADIYDYANTATWKYMHSKAFTNDVTTNTSGTYVEYKTFYNQTGAITEINLRVPTGTFSGGTYILYGVS